MGMIDYGRFARILKRCEEIAGAQGMNASVVQVHGGVLASSATAFLAADGAVTAAESAHGKAEEAAKTALDALDAPYRVARSTAAAFVAGIKLPETLKAQRTDTDKVTAVESLQKVLADHAGEEWAAALAQGEFGQKASVAVKAIKEATAANAVLGQAREARATAYGPAYEGYLKYKRVVRDARGSKSKEYRRIHVRDGSVPVDEGGEKAPAQPAAGQGTQEGTSPANPTPQPAAPSPTPQPAEPSPATPTPQP
jgi:hypothetical protein